MKLLLVWPSAQFSTFDVANGIKAGLEACGHEVADYLLYKRMQLMAGALKQRAPEGLEPDIEMVCLHAAEALPYRAIMENVRWVLLINGMALHPNAVLALRRIGVKVALWLTEAPYDTQEDKELNLAQFADLVFVNERTSVQDVQDVLIRAGNGGIAWYLQHAYNPEVHKPVVQDPEHTCDVLLVGTGFAERQVLLEAIDWDGLDLKLGGLWTGLVEPNRLHEHLRYPCLDNRDTARLYHGAKIVLNPHRRAVGAESANPRTYEAAACGAFQISDYRAEIGELFGDSVPMYEPDVPWQLSALIRRYLADDVGRRQKAQEARERVWAHTFEARARTIVEAIDAYEREHSRRLVGAS